MMIIVIFFSLSLFEFWVVAELAIIHKLFQPNLAIKNMKINISKQLSIVRYAF